MSVYIRAGRWAAPRGGDAAAAALPVAATRIACARGRPARVSGGPEPLGAAALVARRYAFDTELAALPAAVDWPNLKTLCVPPPAAPTAPPMPSTRGRAASARAHDAYQ